MTKSNRAGLTFVAMFISFVSATAGAQELKVWRHGVLESKGDAGFVMMAAKRGFAEKRGLKIETIQFKSGNLVTKALIAGELDSMEAGASEAVVAGARGADVKILGCSWPNLPHVVMVRADINTPQDLKGKTVAISTPGSLPEFVIRTVLAKYGMTPADIRVAAMGADIDRYKSLVAGVTDAAVVTNEFVPIAPKEVKSLLAARDVVPDFVRLCVTTSVKTLTARRDDAVKFVAAHMDALRYAVKNRDATVKLTREELGVKADDPRPEFVFDQTVKNGDVDPDMNIPLRKLDWMQSEFVKTENIKTAVDINKIVDQDVRAKALALLDKGS